MITMISLKLRVHWLLPLAILTAVFGVAGQSERAPKGWKWVKPCTVAFMVPRTLDRQKTDAEPIDSCWATYGDRKLVVSINEDPYAPPFERQPYWQDYIMSPITIAPLTGELITFRIVNDGRKSEKITNVTMLRLGIVRDNSANFCLVIRADPSVDPDVVRKIRETARFTQPSK